MTGSSSARSAFTLVELLVVVAIIGVLVALLLPAIQNVRESGRRVQCVNNLKQMAQACQTFHDAKKRFPPGGASDYTPFGTWTFSGGGTQYGSSWAVYLFPHIEQQTLYDLWKFAGDSGWGANKAVKTGIIQTYLCPSSPLSVLCSNPPQSTSPRMSNSYVAIAGSAVAFPGYTATNTADPGSGAKLANDGVLTPWGQVRLAAITDGTSKTMIIGEYSDWIYDSAGNRFDKRTSDGFAKGFAATSGNYATAEIATWNGSLWGGYVSNLTTIRYPINLKRDPNLAYWKDPANFDCPGKTCGNMPLNSAHANGVNIAFADGSVQWLTDSTSLQVVSSLAVRNDGQSANSTDNAAGAPAQLLNTVP